MESNGLRGRIHVSEATAEELRAKQKEHWLVEREDKIVAKGKGEMQTYWVQVENKSTLRGTSVGQSSVAGEDVPSPESIQPYPISTIHEHDAAPAAVPDREHAPETDRKSVV